MSSLSRVLELNATTSLPLDCSSAADAWIRAGNSFPTLGPYSCDGSGNPTTTMKKKKIPVGARYGLGFGLAALFVMLAFGIAMWKKYKRGKT